MKPEIKKQIILHLPYLAFVYLFGKVGQAFRLAQGADLSAKLLHIGQGFSAAFASAAPSFHPTDLLIGLAAAVIIRLVVYSKQKNAKKYRKGMEYGTARCPKGGIVLDPFMGSGTTGLAAKRHGRHYIGIELNTEFCSLARERIGGDTH